MFRLHAISRLARISCRSIYSEQGKYGTLNYRDLASTLSILPSTSNMRYYSSNFDPRGSLIGPRQGSVLPRHSSFVHSIPERHITAFAFRGGATVIGALSVYVLLQVWQRLDMNQKRRMRKAILTPQKELQSFRPGPLFLSRPGKHAFITEVFSSDPGGPIVITGPQGCGKTMIVKRAIAGRPETVYLDLRAHPGTLGDILSVNFVTTSGYLLPPNELLGRAIFSREAAGGPTLSVELDRAFRLLTEVLREKKSNGWVVPGETRGEQVVAPPLLCVDELNLGDGSSLVDDPTFWRFIDWVLFLTDNRLAHVVLVTSLEVADTLDAYPGWRARRQKVHFDFPRPSTVHHYLHHTLNPFLYHTLRAIPRPAPPPPPPPAPVASAASQQAKAGAEGRAGQDMSAESGAVTAVSSADGVEAEEKRSWWQVFLSWFLEEVPVAESTEKKPVRAISASPHTATPGTVAGEEIGSGAAVKGKKVGKGGKGSEAAPAHALGKAGREDSEHSFPSGTSLPPTGSTTPTTSASPSASSASSESSSLKLDMSPRRKSDRKKELSLLAEGEGPSALVAATRAAAQEDASDHEHTGGSVSAVADTASAAEADGSGSVVLTDSTAAVTATLDGLEEESGVTDDAGSTIELDGEFETDGAETVGTGNHQGRQRDRRRGRRDGDRDGETAVALFDSESDSESGLDPELPLSIDSVSTKERPSGGSTGANSPSSPSPSSPKRSSSPSPTTSSGTAASSFPAIPPPTGFSPSISPALAAVPPAASILGVPASPLSDQSLTAPLPNANHDDLTRHPFFSKATFPSTHARADTNPSGLVYAPWGITSPKIYLLQPWEIDRLVETIGGHLKDLDTVVTAITRGKHWASAVERLVSDSTDHIERVLEALLSGAHAAEVLAASSHGNGQNGDKRRQRLLPLLMPFASRHKTLSNPPPWDFPVNPTPERLAAFARFLRTWVLIERLGTEMVISKRQVLDEIFYEFPQELDILTEAGLIMTKLIKAVHPKAPGANPTTVNLSIPGAYITASSPRMRCAFKAITSDPRMKTRAARVRSALALARLRQEEKELTERLPEAIAERQYWANNVTLLLNRDTALRTSVAREFMNMQAAAPMTGSEFLAREAASSTITHATVASSSAASQGATMDTTVAPTGGAGVPITPYGTASSMSPSSQSIPEFSGSTASATADATLLGVRSLLPALHHAQECLAAAEREVMYVRQALGNVRKVIAAEKSKSEELVLVLQRQWRHEMGLDIPPISSSDATSNGADSSSNTLPHYLHVPPTIAGDYGFSSSKGAAATTAAAAASGSGSTTALPSYSSATQATTPLPPLGFGPSKSDLPQAPTVTTVYPETAAWLAFTAPDIAAASPQDPSAPGAAGAGAGGGAVQHGHGAPGAQASSGAGVASGAVSGSGYGFGGVAAPKKRRYPSRASTMATGTAAGSSSHPRAEDAWFAPLEGAYGFVDEDTESDNDDDGSGGYGSGKKKNGGRQRSGMFAKDNEKDKNWPWSKSKVAVGGYRWWL